MRKRKRHAAQNLIEARIAQLQKNAPKPAAPLAQRDPSRPLWLPDGLDYERVPLEVRQAADEIIQPAYEEMVRDAQTGMEKSLGASIVHLLWLEVLDQFDIKQDYVTTVLTLGMGSDRQTALNQYIRLLDAKLRVGNFLLRLRELRLRERKLEKERGEGRGVRGEGFDSPRISPESTNSTNREIPAASQNLEEPIAWKKKQLPTKNQPPENVPQDPSPKIQDQPCKNEDLPTKNNRTNPPPADPTWKNQQSAPKNPSSDLASQNPSPKPQDQPCKNEDLPTKKETADSHPAAETWKNNQKAPKYSASELAPQAPSPKTEDLSCKTEDLMTKKEPTDPPPSAPTWKNENLPTKNQTPEKVPQDPSPTTEDREVETAGRGRGRPGSLLAKPEGQPCKNEDLMTKNQNPI